MTEPVTFFVQGDPKGQPRARACVRGKHAGVYDPGTADGWKLAVADGWRQQDRKEFAAAVRLNLVFYFRRPKSHFRTDGTLKPGAPKQHLSKPDADNLAKAVMDQLTRLRAWADDRLVCTLTVRREWAKTEAGCHIIISEEAAA